jgi:DNA-directed RNA polymerase
MTFASVHDSYWTHASTVEPMSEVIRDTFIHLHGQDLIGELRKEVGSPA